jgi:hypothetical protein
LLANSPQLPNLGIDGRRDGGIVKGFDAIVPSFGLLHWAASRQGCERVHSAAMAFEPRNLGTGFGVCLLAGDADAQLHASPSICIWNFSWYRTTRLAHRIVF